LSAARSAAGEPDASAKPAPAIKADAVLDTRLSDSGGSAPTDTAFQLSVAADGSAVVVAARNLAARGKGVSPTDVPDRLIAVGLPEGKILFDAPGVAGHRRGYLALPGGAALTLSAASDGATIRRVGPDGKPAAVPIHVPQNTPGAVSYVAAGPIVSPDGRLVAYVRRSNVRREGGGGMEYTVRFHDAESGAELPGLRRTSVGPVTGLAFSPDGTTLTLLEEVPADAAQPPGGLSEALSELSLWDVASRAMLSSVRSARRPGGRMTQSRIMSPAFSPDGKRVAALLRTPVEIPDWSMGRGPGGATLYPFTTDEAVVWDAAGLREIARFPVGDRRKGHRADGLVFGRDGRRLLAVRSHGVGGAKSPEAGAAPAGRDVLVMAVGGADPRLPAAVRLDAPPDPNAEYRPGVFSSDGRRLVLPAAGAGRLHLFDVDRVLRDAGLAAKE
jgi:hypothetical protein